MRTHTRTHTTVSRIGVPCCLVHCHSSGCMTRSCQCRFATTTTNARHTHPTSDSIRMQAHDYGTVPTNRLIRLVRPLLGLPMRPHLPNVTNVTVHKHNHRLAHARLSSCVGVCVCAEHMLSKHASHFKQHQQQYKQHPQQSKHHQPQDQQHRKPGCQGFLACQST